MKFKTKNSQLEAILILFTLYCLLSTFLGCEAFRKKFVRKSKREKEIKVVVHTHEYESAYSVEQTYKKYYTFWRAAHDDLVESLNAVDVNRKKRLFSAKKIVEYLQQMQQLLVPEKQDSLDIYISAQEDIVNQLKKYKLSRAKNLHIKNLLKKQKKIIQEELNPNNIQEYLIKR